MATETTVRTKLVDADGHYYEPPTAIAEYIDPEYRDIAPRRVIGPDGHERIEGKHWGSFNVGGGGAPQFRRAGGVGDGLVGVDRNDGVDIMDRTDRDRHGHEDPATRLKVMDEEGIDVAVLYPSGALTWIPEPEYHHVLSRALNRWLADYASAAPGRLYGAANIVAIHDVEAACDEVRRCVKEHGFKAVFLRTCTAKENDRWWGRQYDPFWATCQELDVAVGFHPFNGDTMFGAPSYFDLWGPGADKLFMRTPFASVVDAMASVMGVIIGGVAERYPDLRFTILESSGGWLVSFLERLDFRFETLGHSLPELKLTPSDYFRRQGWVAFDPEEAPLKLTAEWLGADRIVWGSDYPHPDAFYPGFVTMLNENIAGLDPDAQDRIRGLNAVDLYHLQG